MELLPSELVYKNRKNPIEPISLQMIFQQKEIDTDSMFYFSESFASVLFI